MSASNSASNQLTPVSLRREASNKYAVDLQSPAKSPSTLAWLGSSVYSATSTTLSQSGQFVSYMGGSYLLNKIVTSDAVTKDTERELLIPHNKAVILIAADEKQIMAKMIDGENLIRYLKQLAPKIAYSLSELEYVRKIYKNNKDGLTETIYCVLLDAIGNTLTHISDEIKLRPITTTEFIAFFVEKIKSQCTDKFFAELPPPPRRKHDSDEPRKKYLIDNFFKPILDNLFPKDTVLTGTGKSWVKYFGAVGITNYKIMNKLYDYLVGYFDLLVDPPNLVDERENQLHATASGNFVLYFTRLLSQKIVQDVKPLLYQKRNFDDLTQKIFSNVSSFRKRAVDAEEKIAIRMSLKPVFKQNKLGPEGLLKELSLALAAHVDPKDADQFHAQLKKDLEATQSFSEMISSSALFEFQADQKRIKELDAKLSAAYIEEINAHNTWDFRDPITSLFTTTIGELAHTSPAQLVMSYVGVEKHHTETSQFLLGLFADAGDISEIPQLPYYRIAPLWKTVEHRVETLLIKAFLSLKGDDRDPLQGIMKGLFNLVAPFYAANAQELKQNFATYASMPSEDPARQKWTDAIFGPLAEKIIKSTNLTADPIFKKIPIATQLPQWLFYATEIILKSQPDLLEWIEPEATYQVTEKFLNSAPDGEAVKALTGQLSKSLTRILAQKYSEDATPEAPSFATILSGSLTKLLGNLFSLSDTKSLQPLDSWLATLTKSTAKKILANDPEVQPYTQFIESHITNLILLKASTHHQNPAELVSQCTAACAHFLQGDLVRQIDGLNNVYALTSDKAQKDEYFEQITNYFLPLATQLLTVFGFADDRKLSIFWMMQLDGLIPYLIAQQLANGYLTANKPKQRHQYVLSQISQKLMPALSFGTTEKELSKLKTKQFQYAIDSVIAPMICSVTRSYLASEDFTKLLNVNFEMGLKDRELQWIYRNIQILAKDPLIFSYLKHLISATLPKLALNTITTLESEEKQKADEQAPPRDIENLLVNFSAYLLSLLNTHFADLEGQLKLLGATPEEQREAFIPFVKEFLKTFVDQTNESNHPLFDLTIPNKEDLWNRILPNLLADRLRGNYETVRPKAKVIPTTETDLEQDRIITNLFVELQVNTFAKEAGRFTTSVLPELLKHNEYLGKLLFNLGFSAIEHAPDCSEKASLVGFLSQPQRQTDLQEWITHNVQAIGQDQRQIFASAWDFIGSRLTEPLVKKMTENLSLNLINLDKRSPDFRQRVLTSLLNKFAVHVNLLRDAVPEDKSHPHELTKEEMFDAFRVNLHPALKADLNDPAAVYQAKMEHFFKPLTKGLLQLAGFTPDDMPGETQAIREYAYDLTLNVIGPQVIGTIYEKLLKTTSNPIKLTATNQLKSLMEHMKANQKPKVEGSPGIPETPKEDAVKDPLNEAGKQALEAVAPLMHDWVRDILEISKVQEISENGGIALGNGLRAFLQTQPFKDLLKMTYNTSIAGMQWSNKNAPVEDLEAQKAKDLEIQEELRETVQEMINTVMVDEPLNSFWKNVETTTHDIIYSVFSGRLASGIESVISLIENVIKYAFILVFYPLYWLTLVGMEWYVRGQMQVLGDDLTYPIMETFLIPAILEFVDSANKELSNKESMSS